MENVIEKTNTVTMLEFYASKNIVAKKRTIVKSKESEALCISFLSSDLQTEGDYAGRPVSHTLWFAKTYSQKNELKAGDKIDSEVLDSLIIIETVNANGETRFKIAEAGSGEYEALDSNTVVKIEAIKARFAISAEPSPAMMAFL